MFDSRWFSHTYDRYEPTVATAAGGDQSLTEGSAAASALACRLFPQPGSWRMSDVGVDLQYDAMMLIPNSQALQPEALGDQPHHVNVTAFGTTKMYVVLICFTRQGHYKQCLLQQRRAASSSSSSSSSSSG